MRTETLSDKIDIMFCEMCKIHDIGGHRAINIIYIKDAVKKLKDSFNRYRDLGQMFTGQEIWENIKEIFGEELTK